MGKNMEFSYLLDFYGGMLTDKQREIMEQYYNQDFSLAEIADNFGISRQGARDAIKHGEATLARLEQTVGAAARHRTLARQTERMELLAKRLKYRNASGTLTSRQIDEAAEELLDILDTIHRGEGLTDGV